MPLPEARVPRWSRIRPADLWNRLWGDPRRIVAFLATLAVFAVITTTTAVTFSMRESRNSVRFVTESIQPPMDQLLVAERANADGQAALAAAVATTGDERTQMLARAVLGSQDTKVAWTKFRATAVGLPGEAELVEHYAADYAEATDQTTTALVPILNSTEIGTLPESQISAHAALAADLVALHNLYSDADRNQLTQLERQTKRSERLMATVAAFLLLAVAITAVVAMQRARHVVIDRAARRSASRLASFETRLRRGLELVDDDKAAYSVAERAMREVLPELQVSLLVSDSSGLQLAPNSEAPACGVAETADCPAYRTGLTVSFDDSKSLDACPTLAGHAVGRCSATCVPLKVAGRTAGVLNLVGSPCHPPDSLGATDKVARAVGDRVTMLQALATFQMQATRDPLTGLLNRRSLGSAVEHVLANGRGFAVAFADLDHFKQINDVYGHEAGDAALRSFSRTLRDSVRPEDIVCRWGGEEFVVVLPECTAATAVDAMNRVRTNLALGALAGETTPVTASFGVAQSSENEDFDDVVARADVALRQAKASGRDKVVWVDDPPRLALDLGS